MPITADTRLRLAEQVVAHALEDTLALLDVNTGVYYTIDGVGVLLGDMFGTGITLREVAQRISAEYEVEEEEVVADLVELAEDLLAEGLVVVDDA